MTATPIPSSDALCGYTLVHAFGEQEPCDRPATGWRWYQDVEHEDVLSPACDLHANEGGRRIAAAEADRRRLQEACLRLAASLCMATDGTTSSAIRQIETYVEHLEERVAVAEAQASAVDDWLKSHATTHDVRRTEGYWQAQQDLRRHLSELHEVSDRRGA